MAGVAGGRRLAVPARGARPTSDRVREAVFNTVAARMELEGARVLDLYAGSGGLGLEALSRGAARARLVEADTRTAGVLRRNATMLALPGAGITVGCVEAVLARRAEPAYDLVLLDPPYAIDENELARVLEALPARGWLTPSALVVVERGARNPRPPWPRVVNDTTERRYGDTRVYYGSRS